MNEETSAKELVEILREATERLAGGHVPYVRVHGEPGEAVVSLAARLAGMPVHVPVKVATMQGMPAGFWRQALMAARAVLQDEERRR